MEREVSQTRNDGAAALALVLSLFLILQGVLAPLLHLASFSLGDPLAQNVICWTNTHTDGTDEPRGSDQPFQHHGDCDGLCLAACRHLAAPPALPPALAGLAIPTAFRLVDNEAPQQTAPLPQRDRQPQSPRAPPSA